jgi:hypothetical protein
MDMREIIIDIINDYKTDNGMIHIKNINETKLEEGFVYGKNAKKIVKKAINEINVVDEIKFVDEIKVSEYINVVDQSKVTDNKIVTTVPDRVVLYKDIVTCSYTEYLETDVQNEIVAGTDWNDFIV